MIKVTKDLYIDADVYGYQVKKFTGYDKENNPQYASLTYHSSVVEALDAILKRLQRLSVSENDMTLMEALDKFKVLRNEVMGVLDKVNECEKVK